MRRAAKSSAARESIDGGVGGHFTSISPGPKRLCRCAASGRERSTSCVTAEDWHHRWRPGRNRNPRKTSRRGHERPFCNLDPAVTCTGGCLNTSVEPTTTSAHSHLVPPTPRRMGQKQVLWGRGNDHTELVMAKRIGVPFAQRVHLPLCFPRADLHPIVRELVLPSP